MMWDLLTAWGFLRDYWPWVITGGAAFIAVCLMAWVLGSWKLLLEALAGLGVALMAAGVYRRGAASERERKTAQEEAAMARTRAARAEVERLSNGQVDARLDRWIPK